MNNDTKIQLASLFKSLSDKKDILEAVLSLLAANKKAVDQLASDTQASLAPVLAKIEALDVQTRRSIETALNDLQSQYNQYLASLRENSTITRAEVEKGVKTQNDRAFKRLQVLINDIKLPKDGKPGTNANPADVVPLVMELIKFPEQVMETPESVRDKLETLKADERLDAKAIKGLPDYFKKAKVAGKEMLVGGIRFFENLVDVAIIASKKRQDLLVQYNNTTKRWENGLAFTVSTTQPASPQVNDVWIDIS